MLILVAILVLSSFVFVYYKKVDSAMRLQHSHAVVNIEKEIALVKATNQQLNIQTTSFLQEQTNYKLAILKDQVSMLSSIAEQG